MLAEDPQPDHTGPKARQFFVKHLKCPMLVGPVAANVVRFVGHVAADKLA